MNYPPTLSESQRERLLAFAAGVRLLANKVQAENAQRDGELTHIRSQIKNSEARLPPLQSKAHKSDSDASELLVLERRLSSAKDHLEALERQGRAPWHELGPTEIFEEIYSIRRAALLQTVREFLAPLESNQDHIDGIVAGLKSCDSLHVLRHFNLFDNVTPILAGRISVLVDRILRGQIYLDRDMPTPAETPDLADKLVPA